MDDKDYSIEALFNKLLKDKAEREMMKLIIEGKEPEDIVEVLINEKRKE